MRSRDQVPEKTSANSQSGATLTQIHKNVHFAKNQGTLTHKHPFYLLHIVKCFRYFFNSSNFFVSHKREYSLNCFLDCYFFQ